MLSRILADGKGVKGWAGLQGGSGEALAGISRSWLPWRKGAWEMGSAEAKYHVTKWALTSH